MLIVSLALAAPEPAGLPSCRAHDRPTAFLLTMTPGNSLVTRFGHSALLVLDPELGGDSPVYDHGHFDARDPWFGVEFALQRAEYHGKRRTLSTVTRLYRAMGRDVVAQELRLTPEEIAALQADQESLVGPDRPFVYNWYRANCTTRIRDSLDRALGGQLRPALEGVPGASVHDLMLGHVGGSELGPVMAWGSGARAAATDDGWTAGFVPVGLLDGLAQAERPDGEPLVVQTCALATNGRGFGPRRAPDPRRSFGLVGAVLGGTVGLGGFLPWVGRGLIVLFGSLLALIGVVDLLVFVLETGAPWWTHHNQALANPLALALVLQALGVQRARPVSWAVVGLATLASAVAILRGFPNHDAGPILFVLPGLWASILHLERLRPEGE